MAAKLTFTHTIYKERGHHDGSALIFGNDRKNAVLAKLTLNPELLGDLEFMTSGFQDISKKHGKEIFDALTERAAAGKKVTFASVKEALLAKFTEEKHITPKRNILKLTSEFREIFKEIKSNFIEVLRNDLKIKIKLGDASAPNNNLFSEHSLIGRKQIDKYLDGLDKNIKNGYFYEASIEALKEKKGKNIRYSVVKQHFHDLMDNFMSGASFKELITLESIKKSFNEMNDLSIMNSANEARKKADSAVYHPEDDTKKKKKGNNTKQNLTLPEIEINIARTIAFSLITNTFRNRVSMNYLKDVSKGREI